MALKTSAKVPAPMRRTLLDQPTGSDDSAGIRQLNWGMLVLGGPICMKKFAAFSFPLVAATPVLAQNDTATTVGVVIGGVMGLVILVVVGAVVGWLASLIVKGNSSGFWSNVLLGIGGAMLGGWLLPVIGISFGGLIGYLFGAVAGAVILILIVRIFRKSAG